MFSEGSAPLAGTLRVLFPTGSLEIFIDLTNALGSTEPLTEMSTRDISWG